MQTLADIEARLGKSFLPHQREALLDASEQAREGGHLRLCLYHRTGAGKTVTSLCAMALGGVQDILVLAPPITHTAWHDQGQHFGLTVSAISHAKFRQKSFKVSRTQAIIVDEFHLLGGQRGIGWKKLDRLAQGLQAPLIIMSATPYYNDAERVYCIQHVLDPQSCKGGYLQFLYTHCEVETNPFGSIPLVKGFLKYESAEEYLKKLPRVHFVEDEAIKQVKIEDISVVTILPVSLTYAGLDKRRQRVCASMIEKKHAVAHHQILTKSGRLTSMVLGRLLPFLSRENQQPLLIFCAHAAIAEKVCESLLVNGFSANLITGKTPAAEKKARVDAFIQGTFKTLVGTASLATGTDGIDKMCDRLFIIDDTNDDALRRQLIGRILPRGLDADVSKKEVYRLVFS